MKKIMVILFLMVTLVVSNANASLTDTEVKTLKDIIKDITLVETRAPELKATIFGRLDPLTEAISGTDEEKREIIRLFNVYERTKRLEEKQNLLDRLDIINTELGQ